MRAIGIDLGTTYSAVAVVGATGRPEIVRNREGEAITPSVVLFHGDQPLVGAMAKRSASLAPDDVVQFVKRHMADSTWRFPTTAGEEFTAEQVSAIILKRLKEDAELALGHPCDDVVITVPAYFDDGRRQATRDAAAIAGLNVLRILNEPTAAGLAYGLDHREAGTCLIYDLGGGTFDVTVMRIDGGVFDVLATVGDRSLGGFDFDNALMRWVNDEVAGRGGGDLLEDAALEADLREKCEMAKRTLTSTGTARIFVTVASTSFQVEITRETFERITADLLQRTEIMLDEAMEDAGLRYPDLNRVLLVGGSTRMPMVAAMITRLTGRHPELSVNPDEAVALGAAIQAHLGAPTGETLDDAEDLQVLDVTSQSLGVVCLDERERAVNSHIIQRNTKIPAKSSAHYRTTREGQTELDVRVTEGDDLDLEYVTIVGSTRLTIPPYPAGAPVEVLMSYDIDGLIHVEVIDRTSDVHLGEFEIDREANLDREDVERMRRALSTLGVN